MTPRFAAIVFAGWIAAVALFQLALAAGAPWGEYAMGGAFPGVFPPAMRVAALIQIPVLGLLAAIVLARAGLVLPAWAQASRKLVWVVVGLLAIGLILNLVTPSHLERLIWAPVAGLLLLASLRVALSR